MEKALRIVISGEISQRHLDVLTKESQNLPLDVNVIKIVIKSRGGNANVAAKIVNLIEKLKSNGMEVHTIGSMFVCSAAFIVFIHGSKRTHITGTIFKIDLPHKVENIELLLGYSETRDKLIELLKQNERIINARQEWISRIVQNTNFSAEDVVKFDAEGFEISKDEIFRLGICTKEPAV
ncbi:MAG TPA: hypothetical protein PK886_00245 [Candidatus Paceibacterota bacterium]|nr:hypothetical protein [Candidatus Paceibacterota bacterium]